MMTLVVQTFRSQIRQPAPCTDQDEHRAYVVINLNVSMRLKADAKIFNTEQWGNIKVWLTSVLTAQPL